METRIIKKVSDIKGLEFWQPYIIDVLPADPEEAISEKNQKKQKDLQEKVEEYLLKTYNV